ncbi:MAG: type II secretion system protein [Coriobacteriia bacterium]|nr:type II secretion system protein [Coriobacteriia bacterium]
MRMFKKDEGFTLVELMVVVLIIGILVAIAIPVFNAASSTARERTCHSNMRTIEGAVEQYLAADPANTRADCDDRAWVGVLVGATNYIKSEPVCPSGMAAGTDAVYTYDADPTVLEAACTSDVDTHLHF